MSNLSRLRNNTLFKKKYTRHHFASYDELRDSCKQIFKNELYSEDTPRVRTIC